MSKELTEKWKNRQLESFRWYYVKFKNGEIDTCWLTEWSNNELGTGGQYFDGIKEENIVEVLAPVPSYEKWQLMQDDNKRLKHDVGNLGYKIKNQRKEIERQIAQNAELKKQLAIAIEGLRIYANEDYWLYCCKACGGSYFTLHKDKLNLKYGEYPAKDALYKIKLKEKEND